MQPGATPNYERAARQIYDKNNNPSHWVDNVAECVSEHMASVTRSLKDILSIKIKTRHDAYCDQFSRLFMTKMFVIASVIMGVDYFSDRVSCIVPKASSLSKDFVHAACWISGFFIFKEMETRQSESSYYGIPKKIGHDGMNGIGQLCNIIDDQPGCRPMTRVYYLQFQWMPFYVASLAVLYYMPYIVFRIVNTDLISLKSATKSIACDPDQLVKNYFNYKINPISRLRLRVVLNIVVKLLYILSNILAFYFTDYLLLGNYIGYGTEYVKWARNNSTIGHSFKHRNYPKPGDKLLPSMGYCEIEEAHLDVRTAFHNSNKFICEISPNILYQYVLMVLWFMFIISIGVAVLGLISNICGHVSTLLCFSPKSLAKKQMSKVLTLREAEYLTYIRKKNLVVYGEVLRRLKQTRADMHKVTEGFETSNGFV